MPCAKVFLYLQARYVTLETKYTQFLYAVMRVALDLHDLASSQLIGCPHSKRVRGVWHQMVHVYLSLRGKKTTVTSVWLISLRTELDNIGNPRSLYHAQCANDECYQVTFLFPLAGRGYSQNLEECALEWWVSTLPAPRPRLVSNDIRQWSL